MNPSDPLAHLKDIHLPVAISWWPPALGWWLLLILLLILLLVGLFLRWRQKRRQTFKREALQQIQQIRARVNQQDAALSASQLSALLKRIAMTRHGRQQVAGLHGKAWLAFLDSHGKTQAFSQGKGQCLGESIYRPNSPIDTDALLQLSEAWIKQQS